MIWKTNKLSLWYRTGSDNLLPESRPPRSVSWCKRAQWEPVVEVIWGCRKSAVWWSRDPWRFSVPASSVAHHTFPRRPGRGKGSLQRLSHEDPECGGEGLWSHQEQVLRSQDHPPLKRPQRLCEYHRISCDLAQPLHSLWRQCRGLYRGRGWGCSWRSTIARARAPWNSCRISWAPPKPTSHVFSTINSIKYSSWVKTHWPKTCN